MLVAWFRHYRGRWQPLLRDFLPLRLEQRAAALALTNGLEYVILPVGIVPDGNDPARKAA